MSPYNKDGNLKSKKVTLPNGAETEVSYSENEITATVGDSKYISRSKSDGLSRKLYDEIVLPTATALYRKFDYCEGVIPQIHKDTGKVVGSPTTNLVSKITFTDGKALEYEYDSQERITKVIELENDTVINETVYTYDAKGQLLTETVNNTTVNTMTYDSYGNITSKNGVTYTYGNNAWKDLLTKVGEQEIVYDAQGNPTSYLGHELTWEKGRQLKEYDNLSFKYNANGIRTAKTVGSTTHTYTLDGTKILREFFGGRTIIPMYDNEDEVCGIVYNGNAYYFVKNLQGDVIYITNANGEIVAKYSYDAFGKPTTVFDTSGKNVAYYNPFRYRSYYYDVETGLYYLQSRYYDPEVGRFINGDEPMISVMPVSILNHNMFAYCENNVVNLSDPDGYDAYWITDSKTLAGLGHSSLLVCINNNWYYFYFGANNFLNPINGKANVVFEKLGIEFLKSNGKIDFTKLNNRLKGKNNKVFVNKKQYKGTGYDKYVKISGNFNSVYNYVNNTVKYQKYNVLKENCTWMCIELLKKGKLSSKKITKLENIQYSTKKYYKYSKKKWITMYKKVANVLIPTVVHNKIHTIFAT